MWQQRLVCRHLTEFKTATTGPWRNRVFVGAAVSSRGVQEESSQVRVSWWCSVSTSGRPTPCSPAEVKVSSVIGVSSPPLLRRGVQEESSGSSSSYKFVSNIVSGRSLEQRVCPGGVDESSSVKGSRRRRGSVRATSPACETGLHLVVLSSSAVNLRSRRRRWSSRAVNTGRPAGPVQRPGFVGGGLRSQQQVLHRLRRETCVKFEVYKSAGGAVSRQAVVPRQEPSWSQVCTVCGGPTSPVQRWRGRVRWSLVCVFHLLLSRSFRAADLA